MKKKFDPWLLLITLLLGFTLMLYFYDVFPYPFGFLILMIFFIARLMHLQGGSNEKS